MHRDIYRENKRVGIMVPASDMAVETDFRHFLPHNVDFYTARLRQTPDSGIGTQANYQGLIDSAPTAAASLALTDPDLLAFCCTSASFFKGKNWHWELGEIISQEVDIETITTSAAALTALKTLGASRILLASPYPDSVNSVEAEWLRNFAVDTTSVVNFGCRHSRDVIKVAPNHIIDTVRSSGDALAAADAVFITCTGLQSMGVARELEQALGKPVVTSNSATLWLALSRIGVDGSGVDAGTLFGREPLAIPRSG